MEVRIGLQHTARELTFESELSADELATQLADAFEADAKFITLHDVKKHSYVVALGSLSYAEFGGQEPRKVGFVS